MTLDKDEEGSALEDVRITQAHGPTVIFRGALLAETEFETRAREPLRIRLEVWETEAGALIAVSYAEPVGREGHENARVLVVKPQDDVRAMQFAVLEHFDWNNHARSMARKQLGWSLTLEVD